MNRPRCYLLLGTLSLVSFIAATPDKSESLTGRQGALHLLNRLAFGARPGEVDRLLATGTGT
jgi:hypothetical protein